MITASDLVIDLPRRLVTRSGEAVRLSPKEYDLLAQPGRSRRQGADAQGPAGLPVGPGARRGRPVPAGIHRPAGQKIEADPATPRLILTQPGVGYRFIAN